VLGDPGDGEPDLRATGSFNVALFDFPVLNGVQLEFVWADLNDLTTASVTPRLDLTDNA
jgi:hypothetical protein